MASTRPTQPIRRFASFTPQHSWNNTTAGAGVHLGALRYAFTVLPCVRYIECRSNSEAAACASFGLSRIVTRVRPAMLAVIPVNISQRLCILFRSCQPEEMMRSASEYSYTKIKFVISGCGANLELVPEHSHHRDGGLSVAVF